MAKKKQEQESNKPDNRYIHENMTVLGFLTTVKNDPESIMHDFEVKYAVEVLQHYALAGSKEESSTAKGLLRKAGLEAFISENAKNEKRKSDYPEIRLWTHNQNARNILYERMYEVEKTVQTTQINQITWTALPPGEVARKVIERLYESTPQERDIREIVEGERSHSAINLALSIFCWAKGLPYSSLRRLYFDEWKDERKQYFVSKNKETRGVNWRELEPRPLPERSAAEIIRDHGYAIYLYQLAYLDYRRAFSYQFPFLCDHKKRMEYAKRFKKRTRTLP